MSKVQTAAGSALGKSISETISVDKDELRAIVKEYVQKKFASLAESKKAALVVREGKITAAGSVLGKGTAPQAEAMGGGVPGAMAPIGAADGSPELTKTPADELSGDDQKSILGKKPRKSRTPPPADTEAALELLLYMENDEEIWDRRRPEFIKNLQRKLKRGTYIPSASAKLWLYLVDEAAKKYVREMGRPGDRIDTIFTLPTRMMVAAKLVDMFEEEYASSEPEFMPEGKRGKP